MTDNRFCRKIISEIQKNIAKTRESMDLEDFEKLGGIYIPYPEKSYTRIKKLLSEINSMFTENIHIELTDNSREIYVKIK